MTKTNESFDEDLGDLLQEMRVVLIGAQLLSGFLLIYPSDRDKTWVYATAFICSLISLILLTAPAIWHRLLRPLTDRVAFKRWSTRAVIAAMFPLSISISLSSHLALVHDLGDKGALYVAIGIFIFIVSVWGLLPLFLKRHM